MSSHRVRQHVYAAQSYDGGSRRLCLEMLPKRYAGMILESGVLGVGERLRDVLLDMPLGGGIGAVDDGMFASYRSQFSPRSSSTSSASGE